MNEHTNMHPTYITRPCGLTLIYWPKGQTSVVSNAEAIDIRARLELAEMAAGLREYAI